MKIVVPLFGGSARAALPFFVVWQACAANALAAEQATQAVTDLDAVEVLGEKENRQQQQLEESFFETFSRERLLGDDLRNESVPDVKSALKDVSNVAVTDSGAFSKKVEIRGLSGDRISYQMDDVRLDNQGLTHSGGGELNLIDIDNVDTIDVVKGSPSVIYAPGATGGVVNLSSKPVATNKHITGKAGVSYDSGYDKTRTSASLSTGRNGFGVRINASQTEANGYNVKDQARLDEVIERTNVLDERVGTDDEIKDLGYSSRNLGLQGRYELDTKRTIDFAHTTYQADDISFTHGASTSRVFHYDDYDRSANQLSYTQQHKGQDKTRFNVYQQRIEKNINQGLTKNTTQLDSMGASVRSQLSFDDKLLRVGGEYVHDEAETNTFSEQDYIAAYGNLEYIPNEKWTYTAGARLNHWEVEQRLRPGQNADVASGLVGVSGQLPPQDETALTYAAGVIYSVDDSNNISANFSHTHRHPSLMERFAFDAFVGGGLVLQSEKADNLEIGWKYAKDDVYASAAVFVSEFEDYIGTKETRKIKDQAALQECIAKGDCDPATGDYDDREADFFDTKVHYINVADVRNKGIELSVKKVVDKQMEAGVALGFNDFDNLDNSSRPVELKAHYKKYLDLPTDPWVKVKARYVTDTPAVKQQEGFEPFASVDVLTGGEYRKLKYNAGIRNLFDETYHEPYSALDGLERSISVGVEYDF